MKKKEILCGILLCWAITASFLAGFLWMHRPLTDNDTQRSIQRIKVDVLINYGNTTLIWHNETHLIKGMSVYETLLLVADNVNATRGTSGYYIEGINGVSEDDNHGWVFAIHGRTGEAGKTVDDWYFPGKSADGVTLEQNDKVAFLFYNWAEYGYASPPNPTTNEDVR